MIVVLLLVVIAVLIYVREPQRDYTLSLALLIAASTWLAIEIHLLRLLADFFALAVQNWVDVVMALGALLLLIVPAIMIYVAVRDELDARTAEAVRNATHNRTRSVVLDKFERRVTTLMALGYGRTEAEASALHQMKRDLEHSSVKPGTRSHA
jgi:hypothetical protein